MTRVPSSTMREFVKFCAGALIASTVVAAVLAAVFGSHVWWWAVPPSVIVCALEARRLLGSKTGSGDSSKNSGEQGAEPTT